uniref:Meiosis-specific nuclear structural protein 1 n=1 Tax=Sphenodon punctatus TaxID=8508 RepID=A0A8D0HQV2_SPHPU
MKKLPQLTAAQLSQKKMTEIFHKDMLQMEHEKKVARVRQLEVMWEAADRVEQKRLSRLLRDEQQERQMEEAIQKAEENKRIKELQLEQEERLAAELARLNHEKLKDEKMRQQIRENREKQLKLEKMRATQRYIEDFKREQAIWRRRKREEMEEENRKIMEFANMQKRREKDRMAKVQSSEEKKHKLQDTVLTYEEIEKKIRQRLELRQTYEEQLALKKVVLQAMKEEEETFRQAMLAKFAEDDRIEQMNAQKRRMKQLEHRKAVEKLIEERRKQFLADKERELEDRELEKRREGNIHAIVEEERQKLLKEHATKLLGYLPRVSKLEDKMELCGTPQERS